MPAGDQIQTSERPCEASARGKGGTSHSPISLKDRARSMSRGDLEMAGLEAGDDEVIVKD